MPFLSQRTLVIPKYSRKILSSSARETPGLRACIGLSRHSSVVSIEPCPLTSILPPSRTIRRLRYVGEHTFHLSFRASFSFAASSFFQSSYFAQALKCQFVATISSLPLRTKIGPKSRIHPRLVGT